MCVCVRARARARACMHVSVCVCVRERERGPVPGIICEVKLLNKLGTGCCLADLFHPDL